MYFDSQITEDIPAMPAHLSFSPLHTVLLFEVATGTVEDTPPHPLVRVSEAPCASEMLQSKPKSTAPIPEGFCKWSTITAYFVFRTCKSSSQLPANRGLIAQSKIPGGNIMKKVNSTGAVNILEHLTPSSVCIQVHFRARC